MIDLHPFDGPLFTDGYRRLLATVPGISEPSSRYAASAPPTVRERIVRCIWFDQTLATDKLRTDDGRKLRVLSPGWWNLEAGPDFRNAAIRIGSGPAVKGDVEVHLHASLWAGHGHHTDPAYNRVVLHVTLWRDTPDDTVTTAAARPVPQLTLEPYLTSPVAELADAVDPAEYPEASEASAGRCQRALADGKVTIEWLAHFLDHAGDQRIADKARKLAKRFAAVDDGQVLYEAIAEALGYKRNKAPAVELARRLPFAALRERVADRPEDASPSFAVEGLLFGLAGLLPPEDELLFDEAERDYIQGLRRLWRELGRDLADDALDPAQWSFASTRPPNFPTRRIAGLARLVAAHLDRGLTLGIRDALGDTTQGRLAPRELTRRRAQLLDLFLGLRHPYWDTRSRFGGKPMARGARLIGPDRAHTLVINALLPALLYQARRDADRPFEELLHQLYGAYPKLPSTSITRFMANRLFGRPEAELKTLRSARRQQGLYQLYTDFCDSETATCDRCPLVRLLEA